MRLLPKKSSSIVGFLQMISFLTFGLLNQGLLAQPAPVPQPAPGTPKSSPNYGRHVTCDYQKATCDQGLSISGTFASSLEVTGIQPGATVSVWADTHEPDGRYTWKDVVTPSGNVQFTVYKTRMFRPVYDTSDVGPLFKHLGIGGAAKLNEREMVMSGISETLQLNVGDRTFTIPVAWSPWSVETGGFYAYSFARDEILVTQAVKNPDPTAGPQTHIVSTHAGDRMGPVTGITFMFHPGNYPNFGFEFGQATNGTKPNSYYLGVGLRLLHEGDLALLTLSTGLSHVSVATYPGILPNHDYATDDPRLSGVSRYTNRKYIALGLGINFSASSTNGNAQSH